MMVVFMAMFVLVRVIMTMVVMVMIVHVVMYMEMGDGMCMPMIVFMVIMVMIDVVMMIVVMVVVVGFLLFMAVDGHRHVGAGAAAGHGRLRRHMDAGEPQTVHFLQEGGLLLLAQKLKEGGGEHIPGTPHGTLNVKGFHVTSPPVLPFD